MTFRVLAALLFSTAAGLAHELPGAHGHPHGDGWGSLALLLAAGLLSALFLLPRGRARRRRDENRGPR